MLIFTTIWRIAYSLTANTNGILINAERTQRTFDLVQFGHIPLCHSVRHKACRFTMPWKMEKNLLEPFSKIENIFLYPVPSLLSPDFVSIIFVFFSTCTSRRWRQPAMAWTAKGVVLLSAYSEA